ncbi:glucose-1-phosphate cytidylyltransferase [Paenibacillus sp. TRM 82003]|uniref:glucose-1-phosphate cytidylyltransferase n=1 Tax=Kineococcus sp. TRM81007 TaxID=2925831 RepID=UPI001F57D57D|nr:glucose-1-phosphate cytidylyltransferase [Kineococcus sp. TRM81007]MCI2238913.1 glucose-1-phosphate cytidylyltransferase [Kineococcus sp. TRM81007]MCI3924320.1 glucose-1-phosphate cytidylyltransferase [Paenibacillus sp. TRM 82003]
MSPSDTQTPVSEIPVVILCGGMGTRLREASEKLPKPLVDIGGRPVLWHIMKLYSAHGFRKFVLCLGYKSDMIKRYFLDYRINAGDFTLNLSSQEAPTFHTNGVQEDWDITFVETGLTTATAARIKRVEQHLTADKFVLTYGDGIGDVDITKTLRDHEAGGRLATVTAVHPSSRYGEMHVADGAVVEFNEKPTLADGWVNGGFFVFDRAFADKYLEDDPDMMLEQKPLQTVARDGQLTLSAHEGYWLGMDTFRDWTELNKLWDSGEAPWKIWED